MRLSDGGTHRLDGPRSEVDIIADVAVGVLGDSTPVDWNAARSHRRIREMIAAVIPGYAPVANIDETKQEFQLPGRTFHEPRFATPDGKARFTVHPLPELHGDNGELRLMTVRSEGQFNTVVYEEEDIYGGQDRRDVILLNRADIDRLGLKVDQRVTVRSPAGEMRGIHVREFDIRAGNALMYYPEANVLVPVTTDPRSRTPAFKCVLVTLAAESAAPGLHQLASWNNGVNGSPNGRNGHEVFAGSMAEEPVR